MNSSRINRRHALSLAGSALIGGNTIAAAQTRGRSDEAEGSGAPPLPADVTTQHALELPDRTLRFTATAGGLRLTGGNNAPLVDLAFVAFQLVDTDKAHRPVTFAFNGGPGFASAWLNVGVTGPWRIPLGGEATAPSASPEPLPNTETWLDFTDLVFIDPAGTGYSRILNNDARKRLWSVAGDIEYLAEAIRHWLDRSERDVSPKYLLGESYGGFRAPRLTRELAASEGTGISGMMLLSPALDFGGRSSAFDPFYYATRLPSMAAAARSLKGALTRADVADVERYALTDYLLDVTRGERDATAIARRSARVAELTGLDPAVVRHYHGVLSADVFLHELERAQGRVGSIYDATITTADPFPLEAQSDYPDPVLEALKAPVSSAMVNIYETLLKWRPDNEYRLGNPAANRAWDWGGGMWSQPQSMHEMRTALALDPQLSVHIAHGLFDLITPYFSTQLLLDQVPEAGIGDRIHLSVHPGGHMFYTNDASRAALRGEAAALFGKG